MVIRCVLTFILLITFTCQSLLWAAEDMLAPKVSLTQDEFRDEYAAGNILLSHKITNGYIRRAIYARIHNIGQNNFDTIKDADLEAFGKEQPVDLKQVFGANCREDSIDIPVGAASERQSILIAAIPGLLEKTGQFAQVGLGRKNGVPVIYVDNNFFNNEQVLKHEKDEIAGWDAKRRELGLEWNQMRGWIRGHLEEAKALGEAIHTASNPIAELYARVPHADPRSVFYVNLNSIYGMYAKLADAGEPALDRDDRADVHVAAGAAGKEKTLPAEMAWRRLRSIGTLDEIRKMSLTEFAVKTGAKALSTADLPRAIFYLSPEMFAKVERFRQTGVLLANFSEISLYNLRHVTEINGPGTYFSAEYIDKVNRNCVMAGSDTGYNKATFFHEMAEQAYVECGIVDRNLILYCQHADLGVLEQELLFARLLGETEARQTTAVFTKMLETEASRIMLTLRSGIPPMPAVLRQTSFLRELLMTAAEQRFHDKAKAAWDKAAAADGVLKKPKTEHHFTSRPVIDMHIHSTFSDGEDTPEQIIDKAAELGVKAVSITDHDTLGAYLNANGSIFAYARGKGVELIVGAEASSLCEDAASRDGYCFSDLVVYFSRKANEKDGEYLERLRDINSEMEKKRLEFKKCVLLTVKKLMTDYPGADMRWEELVKRAARNDGKNADTAWKELGRDERGFQDVMRVSDPETLRELAEKLPNCMADFAVPLAYVVEKLEACGIALPGGTKDAHELNGYILDNKDGFFGKRGDKWNLPEISKAIKNLSEEGGIVFLAHPFGMWKRMEEVEKGNFEKMIERAKENGLRGIEAFSRGQTLEESLHFQAIAEEKGLVTTNASDHHRDMNKDGAVSRLIGTGTGSGGNATSVEMLGELTKAGLISEETKKRIVWETEVFKRLRILPSFKLRTTKEKPVYPVPQLPNFEVTHIYKGAAKDIKELKLSDTKKTVHFMLIDHKGERVMLNLCDPETKMILASPDLYEELKEMGDISLFSLHLGFAMEKSKETGDGIERGAVLSDEEVRERIVENVRFFKEKLKEHKFGEPEVLLENMAYFDGMGYVCSPKVIREILDETKCGLLLDLGHLIVTARSPKSKPGVRGGKIEDAEDPVDHVKRILDDKTVGNLREIHISVPFYDESKKSWVHGGYGKPYGSLWEDTPGTQTVKELLFYILKLRKSTHTDTELIINLETDDEFAARDAIVLEGLLCEWEAANAARAGISASTAACLEAIKDDEGLLANALDPARGITAAEVAGASDKEFEILKDLGILTPVSGQSGRYRFADMLSGQKSDDAKTLINAILGTRYQLDRGRDEQPLLSGDIPAEQRPVVREAVLMSVLNQMNLMLYPVLPQEKVLWHLVDHDLVSESQRSSFAQQVNQASFRSEGKERIYITREGETLAQAIAAIKGRCPNAVFDAALSRAEEIDAVPEIEGGMPVRMLAFEGEPRDFTQLGGVIAALRALHLGRDEAIPALQRVYAGLCGRAFTGRVPPPEAFDDPRAFAQAFIFTLPPAAALPIDDIQKLNNQLLKFLTAA